MKLEHICASAKEIVLETADFIRYSKINFKKKSIQKKGLHDLVSFVDLEAEKKLVSGLSEILPEAGFITEENTRSERKEYNWIIDPLDGTTNFIHGIPTYCVSVALERDNEIQIGIVHEIVGKETFYSVKNGKSFMNTKQIKVSSNKKISDSLIGLGIPVNEFKHLEEYKNALEYFIKNTRGVRRIGSAAADLCYVACGRFDGFFELNLKPWDVAAGALIVKNAGGIVTDFSGKKDWLFGKNIMASSKNMHVIFKKTISSSFKNFIRNV